jgi:hypothetical protein
MRIVTKFWDRQQCWTHNQLIAMHMFPLGRKTEITLIILELSIYQGTKWQISHEFVCKIILVENVKTEVIKWNVQHARKKEKETNQPLVFEGLLVIWINNCSKRYITRNKSQTWTKSGRTKGTIKLTQYI